MHLENEIKLDFKDVLIRPQRSTIKSRSEVDLYRQFVFRNSGQTYSGIPIMASNMEGVGTFKMAEELSKHGLFTCLHKHYSVTDLKFGVLRINKTNFAYSMGMREEDLTKFSEVYAKTYLTDPYEPSIKYICLDVANGYTEKFVEVVRHIRSLFPKMVIIAGNVVTGEMTQELIINGADIVKVGIGPGSVCTTRLVTGVGFPQLSAIIECANAAHGLKGHIIADGGCRSPGDVAKAFGAGADFVMLGGMLAGHTEGGNYEEVIQPPNGRRGSTILNKPDIVKFSGSSSKAIMDKHYNGQANYKAAEGKSVQIPFRGPVSNTIQEILGGLRSTCAYVGAAKLKELTKRCTFVRVTQQYNDVFN